MLKQLFNLCQSGGVLTVLKTNKLSMKKKNKTKHPEHVQACQKDERKNPREKTNQASEVSEEAAV